GYVVKYIDSSANPNLQSYTYRVVLVNTCGHNVDSTNIGQTIFLTAVGNDNTGINTLSWNDYSQWNNGPLAYTIYRSTDSSGFSLLTTVPYTAASENTYQDNV